MGLAERRAIKDFQDNHLPKLKAEIDKAAGFDVPLEVNWEQLAVEGSNSYFFEAWTEIFFTPVIEALRQIGRDDMGKDALKSGLKKIEFRNLAGNSSPGYAITFQNGTLAYDHSLANIGDTADRTKTTIELMEKSL
jgi:hypothetical protein